MPKMTHRHKRKNQSSAPGHSGVRSIGDLLNRGAPILSRIGDQRARQSFWRDWLLAHLPAELAPRITGAVERDGALTVFADSAAWSARLRYALQELDTQLRAADANIKRVVVRVMPGKPAERPSSGPD